MSHQSGIKASENLETFLISNKNDNFRCFYIQCCNEELVLQKSLNSKDDWEKDFDNCIYNNLNNSEPSYIFYRMDSMKGDNFDWIFIVWIPNDANVRQKMLYASTRATLKKIFGDSIIIDEIIGHSKEDLSLESYKVHIKSKLAPKPLTSSELEFKEVKRNEISHSGLDTAHQTMVGTEFPLVDDVLHALEQFKLGELNYIQLKLDIKAETVNLVHSSIEPPNRILVSVHEKMSNSEPFYHLFNYQHNYKDSKFNSIIFLYSYVGYTISVKQRMLYSSCRNPLIARLEIILNQKINLKMEVESNEEKLNEESILASLHPEVSKELKASDKPRPPGRKGTSNRLLE